MKYIIGVLLILAGIVLGFYVGIHFFLLGGVTNVANGWRANPVNAGKIVWGILQITPLAELVGSLAAIPLIILGLSCFHEPRPIRNHLSGKTNRDVERQWERLINSDFFNGEA